MTKNKDKQQTELEQQLGELTQDLQRQRADFENYRKRVDAEKELAKAFGREQTVLKLLPVIDTIERALSHMPDELKGNKWAEGIASMSKNISKLLEELKLERVLIVPGETPFDPNLHHAISTDESEGESEVVAEELQAGYTLDGNVVREALVKVTRK